MDASAAKLKKLSKIMDAIVIIFVDVASIANYDAITIMTRRLLFVVSAVGFSAKQTSIIVRLDVEIPQLNASNWVFKFHARSQQTGPVPMNANCPTVPGVNAGRIHQSLTLAPNLLFCDVHVAL